jgi:hypothetical protein
VPNAFTGYGNALLFDASYNRKPTYDAAKAALGGGS